MSGDMGANDNLNGMPNLDNNATQSSKPVSPSIVIEQDRGVQTSEAQLKKPSFNKLAKVPAIVKSTVVKMWFAGSLYYFIGWGIFSNTVDNFDTIAALGLAMGLFTDLLIYRLFKMIDNSKNHLNRYIFWQPKRVLSLFINIFYCLVVSFLVGYTYHFINLWGNIINNTQLVMYLGADPFLYGTFFVVFDLAILSIRNLIKLAIKKPA